jgi:lipoprotein-releasing system permease protein
MFSALRLEKLGMILILLLIVIVAGFNISSTLIMVVSDRMPEIGILRAMGMTAHSIRSVFLAQGLVLGVFGTALGSVIGLAASALVERRQLIKLEPAIYFIDHLPVVTQWGDVFGIAAASILIATIGAIYPAARAARLYPVEAIRHD